MAMSSSDSILSLAKDLKEMPMFPVFHIVDSLLTSVYVRHQFGSKAYGASRKHPLALWFVTILSIKAGTLITALLLGEPVLDPFKHTKILLTNTLCWYALFYSPYDIVYRICTCGPLAIGLGTLNEIYRVHRIFHGIQHTSELYPDSWTIMMFVGTIKGNSSALVEFTQMLIRGDWKTNLNSFQISFLTKASFCGSLALVATQHSHILLLVYFCVCMFLVYNQIVSALIGPQDPFLAIEKVVDKVFFGGLWDKWIKQDTGNNEKPHEQ